MFVADYQTELQHYLAQAAELLGGPVRPVWLEWDLEQLLEKQVRWEASRGLGTEPPIVWFTRSLRGHQLAVGMERCRWETEEGPIRLVRVVVPCEGPLVPSLWAVRTTDYRRFFRCFRRDARRRANECPPILPDGELQRLWTNTIGFLRHGQEEMRRYGITPKRGVLLSGEPGNGKTMACRWLAGQCEQYGLEWKCVSAQDYEDAHASRRVPGLFQLDEPGIVLFDDFDTALRHRGDGGDPVKQSTFLTELDGVDQKTGIVYLFASNLPMKDMDPAMCRPGRIDLILQFPRPDAPLRRQVIEARWHPDLRAGIDLESVVRETSGMSFAELEEAKKLLVLRRIETGQWDWAWVRGEFRQRQAGSASRPIGFAPSSRDENGESSYSLSCEGPPLVERRE